MLVLEQTCRVQGRTMGQVHSSSPRSRKFIRKKKKNSSRQQQKALQGVRVQKRNFSLPNLQLFMFIYLFIYLLFSHNKDYTSITLYKDVARGPQKTTRLVRGGPLVTIILSNRTITTHNNGQYKTHYRVSSTLILFGCCC